MSLFGHDPWHRIVVENIFETAIRTWPNCSAMGANISLNGNTAWMRASPSSAGAPVKGTDLRASAAMVLAGLAAEGTTPCTWAFYLDRGATPTFEAAQQCSARDPSALSLIHQRAKCFAMGACRKW